MHEFALVEQVLDLLRQSAAEKGIEQIDRVTLVVGKGSTFVPEVIAFLFKAMATEPPFTAATELVLVEEPVRVRCRACAAEYELEGWRWVCTQCARPALEQLAGDTVYIESYEGGA